MVKVDQRQYNILYWIWRDCDYRYSSYRYHAYQYVGAALLPRTEIE